MNTMEFILYCANELSSIGISFSFGLLVVRTVCKMFGRHDEVGPSYDKLTKIVVESTIVITVVSMVLTAIFK